MPIFMKCEVKGESTADGHKDEILLNSFQWGAGLAVSTEVGSGQSRSASAASISEITVTKMLDNATPVLFQKLCSGTTIPKVEIFFTIASGKDVSGNDAYLTYTLTDVFISGISLSSGGERPSESLSLNYLDINIKYLTGDTAGNLTAVAPEAYWNLASNKSK